MPPSRIPSISKSPLPFVASGGHCYSLSYSRAIARPESPCLQSTSWLPETVSRGHRGSGCALRAILPGSVVVRDGGQALATDMLCLRLGGAPDTAGRQAGGGPVHVVKMTGTRGGG